MILRKEHLPSTQIILPKRFFMYHERIRSKETDIWGPSKWPKGSMVVMPADRTNPKKEFVKGALHGLVQRNPGLWRSNATRFVDAPRIYPRVDVVSSKGSLTIDQASVLKKDATTWWVLFLKHIVLPSTDAAFFLNQDMTCYTKLITTIGLPTIAQPSRVLSNIFKFHPKPWGNDPNLTNTKYFLPMGLVKNHQLDKPL